jgi:hypothetical protein
MARAVLVIAAVGVTIYALIDCIRSEPERLRGMPRVVWLLLIVLLAPVGAVIWLVFGREPSGGGGGGRGPRVIAPDDDPDFLRSLDVDARHPKDPDDKQ